MYIFMGWFSFFLSVLLLVRYITRKKKMIRLTSYLKKLHKPLGITLLLATFLHGVNAISVNFESKIAILLGMLSFILIVIMIVSFILRKKLKAKWFKIHSKCAVIFLFVFLAHILAAIVL